MKNAKPAVVLEAEVKVLRAALRVTLACLKNGDKAHVVVDIGRSGQGLGLYLKRILRDTR